MDVIANSFLCRDVVFFFIFSDRYLVIERCGKAFSSVHGYKPSH